MRRLISGLFVFVGVLISVGVLGAFYPQDDFHWIFAIVPCGVGAVLTIIALRYFNVPCARPFGYKTIEDHISHLKEQGLIEPEKYCAKRAFQVEEYEDEGLHYYIELQNSFVLYLSGQYLYEYVPADDDDIDIKQLRRFPCTEFTLYKHKGEGIVVGIECQGDILNPECTAKPFDEMDYKKGNFHEDGQIIQNQTYDELKIDRMKKS